MPCPLWNPGRPPKWWFDPKAKDSKTRNIAYTNVLAIDAITGQIVLDDDGKPTTDVLLLTKEEAGSVNIPPNWGDVPGAAVNPIPFPMRSLNADEEWILQFGGTWAIKNKTVADQEDSQSAGFLPADRVLLKAIALKMGVEV